MDTYLKTADSEWYKQRLNLTLLWAVAAFVILFARLFYLQVIEGREYHRLSENNCIRLQSIDPSRGLIFDARGRLLVDNRPAFDLHVIPKDAKPLDDTLARLAGLLRVAPEELKAFVSNAKVPAAYKPVVLRSDIGRDTLAVVEARQYDLPGVRVETNPRRNYIHPTSAAHLLGYLGEINQRELKSGHFPGRRSGDLVGKFGVEKTFEQILHGVRGGRQVEVDATGQVVRVLKTVEARPGHNVFLTIDQPLQKHAETLLQGVAGAVAAMDPANGHVLALASSPSFDQNAFVNGLTHQQWNDLRTNPLRPMENKAIQGEYPPASTYKIVTALAGLEEGVIDENSTFFCPGHYKYGDRVFRCWKKGGHGKMNVVSAIEESCDVFFYQVGLKLGVDRLAWYAKAGSLGTATGIALDHESHGLIPTAGWKRRRTGVSWQRGETLSVAIGQGYNLATPLQMAVFTAAVANGGTRYKPQILKRIESADGSFVRRGIPEVLGKLPVSPANLNRVRRGMWKVVQGSHGTARGSRLKKLDICGKTGTAQVISRRGNESTKEEDLAAQFRSHAWFVAYAPAEDPRIAVSVIVEHGEHGSSAAAPVASKLIAAYLQGAQVALPSAGRTLASSPPGRIEHQN